MFFTLRPLLRLLLRPSSSATLRFLEDGYLQGHASALPKVRDRIADLHIPAGPDLCGLSQVLAQT